MSKILHALAHVCTRLLSLLRLGPRLESSRGGASLLPSAGDYSRAEVTMAFKSDSRRSPTASQVEKAITGGMQDLADFSKMKIAENIAGLVKLKKIRSSISDDDLRALISVAEMSVDQAISTVGGRASKSAREIADP